jgi:CrcB protein
MGFFLLVCLGGAAGTAARFLLGVSMQKALGVGFPYGTLAVNLIGSFLITLFMHVGATKGLIGNDVRIILCTGVLGGFTTYSSFNFETIRLWQQGSIGLGLLNIGVTMTGCLIMGGLGLVAGRLVAGA